MSILNQICRQVTTDIAGKPSTLYPLGCHLTEDIIGQISPYLWKTNPMPSLLLQDIKLTRCRAADAVESNEEDYYSAIVSLIHNRISSLPCSDDNRVGWSMTQFTARPIRATTDATATVLRSIGSIDIINMMRNLDLPAMSIRADGTAVIIMEEIYESPLTYQCDLQDTDDPTRKMIERERINEKERIYDFIDQTLRDNIPMRWNVVRVNYDDDTPRCSLSFPTDDYKLSY